MLFVAICLLTAHPAFSQTPYYAGKTITMIRGGGPGGSGEFQSRALMPYLKKYTRQPHHHDGVHGWCLREKGGELSYTAKPDGLKIGSAGAMIPGPILGLREAITTSTNLSIWAPLRPATPTYYSPEKRPASTVSRNSRSTSGMRIGAHSVGHSVYVTADVRLLSQFQGPQIRRGLYRPGNGCRYGRRRAGCQDIEQC